MSPGLSEGPGGPKGIVSAERMEGSTRAKGRLLQIVFENDR